MTPRRGRMPGLLLALVIIGAQPGAGAVAQAPSSQPPSGGQPTLTAAVDDSIAALAAELGGDPAAARAWVADQVTAEAYPGVLKGARGAYLTGAANSADQALLLAALLGGDDPMVPVRFATCQLDAPQPSNQPVPLDSPLDHADEIVAEVSDPGLAAAVIALRDYRARVQERTAAAGLALEASLATVADPAPSSTTSVESSATHTWLQVEQGGIWVDQDPSSATGEAPCTADSTVDTLPDSLSHRVRFALTLERQLTGQLETSTALEAEFPIADLAASRIGFGFAEPIGLIERPPDDGTTQPAYTPVLRIDNESVIGDAFVLPRVPAAEEDGGGGLDSFGGFDGDLGGDEPAAAVEVDPVTAAWLDIELTAPDGEVTSLRSEVFDRIGVVARAGGTAASTPVEPLAVVDQDYAALDTLWQVGLLLGEPDAARPTVDASLDIVTVDGLSGSIDALLRLFPALRRDLGGASTEPVVLLAGLGPVTGPEKRGGLVPGEVATQLTFDALHVPADASTDRAEAARDAQAILAAEGMLGALSGGSVDPLGDAGAVFRAATDKAVPMLTVEPGASSTGDRRIPAGPGQDGCQARGRVTRS